MRKTPITYWIYWTISSVSTNTVYILITCPSQLIKNEKKFIYPVDLSQKFLYIWGIFEIILNKVALPRMISQASWLISFPWIRNKEYENSNVNTDTFSNFVYSGLKCQIRNIRITFWIPKKICSPYTLKGVLLWKLKVAVYMKMS